MEEKTEYKLKRPLEYNNGQGLVQAECILLSEPDHSNPENYYKLTDMLTQSQIKMQKAFIGDKTADDLDELKEKGLVAEQVKLHETEYSEEELQEDISAIEMGIANAGFTLKFHKVFVKMISNSRVKKPALVDGLQDCPLNATLFSQMHPEDQKGVVYRWVAFFETAADERRKRSLGVVTDSDSTRTEL